MKYFNSIKFHSFFKIPIFLIAFLFLFSSFLLAAPQPFQEQIPNNPLMVNPEIDIQPPNTPLLPAPTIEDDGVYTRSDSQLHATWSAPKVTQGTISTLRTAKIVEYKYSIGTSPGATDVTDGWVSAGKRREITVREVVIEGQTVPLILLEAQTYYFNVRGRDMQEKWTKVGSSDGITVDLTPPVVIEVVDGGEFTYDKTQLNSLWHSENDGAPIEEYQYAIGTTQGEFGNNVVGWTSVGLDAEVIHMGLSLVPEITYYFNVKARNAADGWSEVGSSDGIIVVNREPEIMLITPENNSTFTEGDQIDVQVQAQDPDGDDIEFRYLVDGEIIQDWISSSSYFWQTQLRDARQKIITIEVKDGYGATISGETTIFLYRKAIKPE